MRLRHCLVRTTTSLALALSFVFAHAQTPGNDLLPPLDNPKVRFTTGRAVNNKPEFSPILPAIAGGTSPWSVTQWSQSSYLTGADLVQNDPTSRDAVLGSAPIGFNAADGHAHVWIYSRGPTGHPVFELYENGGALKNGGGSDLFLTTKTNPPFPSFDRAIDFSMLAKISHAAVSYNTPMAQKTGAVLAQAAMSFVLQFPSPLGGAQSTLFLQVALAKSGKNIAKFRRGCVLSRGGNLNMFTTGTLGGTPLLPFQPDAGPLHQISFSVNDYVNAVFNQPIKCRVKGGAAQIVPLPQVAMSNIVLKSVYVGPETEVQDLRPQSVDTAIQGTVEMGLQISDPQLVAH